MPFHRSFLSFVLILLAAGAQAATLRVPGDYSTVGKALQAAGAGDTIRLGAGKHPPFVVFEKNDIEIVGATGHRIEGGFRVTSSVGITLRGLRVKSGAPAGNAFGPLGGAVGGIRVDDSVAVLVKKCLVSGSIGIRVTDSDGVTVSRNRLTNPRIGISALESTGFTLRRNLVLDPLDTGIEVSGEGLVKGNKVEGGGSDGGGIYVIDGLVDVLQNRIEDVRGNGITIRSGDQHRVELNEVLGADGDGIVCAAGEAQRVDRNLVKRTAHGIRIGEGCTGNLLVENRVKKVRRDGIWIESAGNQVTDNQIKGVADFGIDLTGTGNTVTGNTIKQTGIGEIDDGGGNTVSGNSCPDDPEACD